LCKGFFFKGALANRFSGDSKFWRCEMGAVDMALGMAMDRRGSLGAVSAKARQSSERRMGLRSMKAQGISSQREKIGLSQLFLAVLLNIHETSLMNMESGVSLPTEDVASRMNYIGLDVQLTEPQGPSGVSALTDLERLAFQQLRNMPIEKRWEWSDNVSIYVAVKRSFDQLHDRDAILLGIASVTLGG
jgi:DNA-binding transcriptional regulator YiaG